MKDWNAKVTLLSYFKVPFGPTPFLAVPYVFLEVERLMEIKFPNKKYNIIYCDPPWSYHLYRPQYSNSKNHNHKGNPIRTAASFYKTMTIDEICKLPVADIAAE